MERELSPALAKRLAAYAASAGIMLALAPEANAQVVYHDIDPDAVIEENPPNDFFDLDFDDNGTADLRLRDFGDVRYYSDRDNLYRAPGANMLNAVLIDIFYHVARTQTGFVLRFDSGEAIGPDVPWYDFVPYGLIFTGYASNYPDCDPAYIIGDWYGEKGYAGFRFVAGDGEVHYGWIRLSVNECPFPLLTTAYEYGFEMTPDTPILAGARSAALLDGDVNQTTFPASGGTLVYTVTVENTTDEPQPLDLWLDADGPAAFTRRLGSGTLPPGATVSRTVRVQVPAGAPAGEYDVRFKLGHFAARRFITFERYAVTKEGGAVPTPAGSAEPFAVAPVEGDLFAGARTVEAIVGTHALSAPSPNPAEDRVALTLEVAEAQHVAVTVHDALGREVAVLHDGPLTAGEPHRVPFDGSGLPVGVYVVRAVGERFADTRVISLIR